MNSNRFKETEIGLIPEDWDVKPVKDFCIKITSGGTPSRKKTEYWENGTIKWLKTKELNDSNIFSTEEKITEAGFKNSSAKLFDINTIIMAMYGATVGKLGIIKEEMTTNQACCALITDIKISNPLFLFYALLNYRTRLINLACGAAQQNLNQDIIKGLKIPFPSKLEQDMIAKILVSIDDKIELNHRMNQTLEAIGQAIFRHWFVHFEFPNSEGQPYKSSGGEMVDSELGEIPKGWEVGTLADLCELNANSWTTKTMPGEIHYVDLANTKNGIISNIQIFDGEEAPSRAKRILLTGDTIFGTVRPSNRSFTLIGDQEHQLTGSTGFAVLTPNNPNLREIVHLITTSEENINRLTHLADGAAYPAVRPNVVTDEICFVPSEKVIKSFHKIVGPLFNLILSNRYENVNLRKIRDSLLPKLMYGKIRVNISEEATVK